MDGRRLNALLAEYRLLSASAENHWRVPYQVVSVCAAAGAVFAVYRAQEPGLAGVVFAYGLTLAVLTLGFAHAMVSGFGIRLVEIELLINEQVKLESGKGLKWFTLTVGDQARRYPGYRFFAALTSILLTATLFLSLYGGWFGLTQQLGLPLGFAVVVIVLPIPLVILTLWRMWAAEHETLTKKRQLLDMFRGTLD